MSRKIAALLVLVTLAWASSARAAATNVKCAMNEDRVWVYESVADFNLAAKLKCGEPVEIVGRVKGYVKIQTQAGVEGYVADSSIPKADLPPEPEEKSNDVQSASLAAHARRGVVVNSSSAASTTASTGATVAVKSNSTTTSSPVASNVTIAPVPTPTVSAAPAVSRPAPPTMAPPPKAQPIVASAPPAPAPASKPAPPKVASNPASQPADVEITLSTAPTPSLATPPPSSKTEPVATTPAAPASAPVVASQPVSVSNTSNAAVVASNAAEDRETAAPTPGIQPVSDTARHPAARAANPDEDEDATVSVTDNQSAGCTHFFSAYGLSPNQYKWLAQNRKKAFPTICPAPTPAMVDFVVIFTHDVAFYNVTMPTAVHVDSNGFSDWTPMSTVDTALMTQSEANSSHHEYVWVFHTTRGAFDPSKFSAKRKPLFSKGETNMLGSHGGYKTVMDALTYIESNGTNR